jgi:DNA polymerase III subunit gamma/tau
MAYQVLARKYRPQRFSDVIGQEHVTRTLGQALQQQRIAHGYIFSGHRGIGKTTIARILAMALNCRNTIGSIERPSPEPCGICDSCKEIRAGNSLDVVEIDAATNRGIDEIRELRDAARYAPARDRYKIYLLDEAHQITDAAFNALLKTLEEPPEHVVFMMATTQPEDIPQTIRSRCQHFSFHAVKFDDIVEQLTQIALQEGILADPQALALLAEAGDGSMRDALSIMDQAIASAPMVDGKAKLDGNEIRELMGAVPDAVFERILEGIGEGQSAAVMEELNRLLNAGNSPSQMARQLVRYLRNCLMAKLGGEKTELLQISGDERARALRTATIFSEEDLTRFLQVMLRTFDELNYRQEPRLHLELGLMKLVHLQRLLPLEQILSGLPGAGSTPPVRSTPRPSPTSTPRLAPVEPPRPIQVESVRPAAIEPIRPKAIETPTPFELDSQRKVVVEEPALPPPPVQTAEPEPVRAEPVHVVATPVETSPVDNTLDTLRDAITAALDAHGQHTAASLLGDGRWKTVEEGAIQVEVGVRPTMLGLTMNGEVWKIVREALRAAGGTQKMTVVPGEAGGPSTAKPRAYSRDSIEAVALGNPLVRQAQEMFQAEVRSVLDLRDGPGGRGKG